MGGVPRQLSCVHGAAWTACVELSWYPLDQQTCMVSQSEITYPYVPGHILIMHIDAHPGLRRVEMMHRRLLPELTRSPISMQGARATQSAHARCMRT